MVITSGTNNLNSSIKKVSGGNSSKGAGNLRTSTNRSSGMPGAENTKGSNSSQIMRKSNAGGSSSTRKQSTTNYIKKSNWVDESGAVIGDRARKGASGHMMDDHHH